MKVPAISPGADDPREIELRTPSRASGAPTPSPRSLLDPDLAAAYAAFLMHYFLPVSWVRAFICPEIADVMAGLEAAGGAR